MWHKDQKSAIVSLPCCKRPRHEHNHIFRGGVRLLVRYSQPGLLGRNSRLSTSKVRRSGIDRETRRFPSTHKPSWLNGREYLSHLSLSLSLPRLHRISNPACLAPSIPWSPSIQLCWLPRMSKLPSFLPLSPSPSCSADQGSTGPSGKWGQLAVGEVLMLRGLSKPDADYCRQCGFGNIWSFSQKPMPDG